MAKQGRMFRIKKASKMRQRRNRTTIAALRRAAIVETRYGALLSLKRQRFRRYD
jgi:hypothetical protein